MVIVVTVRKPPAGLSARAREFWRDYHSDGRTLSALEVALLVEAVRLMTRADDLNAQVLSPETEDRRAALVEARLTATALKGVVAELRQHNAGGRAVAGPSPAEEAAAERKAVSAVDQLSARRAARRADAAGGVVPGGEE